MTAQGDVLTRAQIVQINASRMTDLFEGHFAGVQVVPVNGRPTLMVRGQPDPLIEVDGVPLADPQSLWSLYPRQVEEIRILKGEQTARYGLRGARGVVLVTTRDQ
jgi:TonB-dependent SusC/RagA subfamily outer membrane receptor